jgi:predicted dehydrogenase
LASILVIGRGSIGSRHCRVASELGHEVCIVSRRNETGSFATVGEAFSSRHMDAAIIATETAAHGGALRSLLDANFTGAILVEKPLFSHSSEGEYFPRSLTERVRVAYNLRFHPLLLELRKRVQAADRVLNVVVHVGQDLRQWRAGRPVEQTYSTSKSKGGGALRDLSHELDYLTWLFGPWRSVCATGGRVGDLPGDADDCWGILLSFESGAMVTLALDYFCRQPVRTITVNTTSDTIQVDLVRGVLADCKGEVRVTPDRDLTYREQLRALVADRSGPCDFDQGLAVLQLIEAIEESAASAMRVVR